MGASTDDSSPAPMEDRRWTRLRSRARARFHGRQRAAAGRRRASSARRRVRRGQLYSGAPGSTARTLSRSRDTVDDGRTQVRPGCRCGARRQAHARHDHQEPDQRRARATRRLRDADTQRAPGNTLQHLSLGGTAVRTDCRYAEQLWSDATAPRSDDQERARQPRLSRRATRADRRIPPADLQRRGRDAHRPARDLRRRRRPQLVLGAHRQLHPHLLRRRRTIVDDEPPTP